MKIVEAEYIESGAFQAGEEDVFCADINHDEEVVIIKKSDWEKIQKIFDRPTIEQMDKIDSDFEVLPIGIQFECQWGLYLKGMNDGSMCYTTDINRAKLIAEAWNRYQALKNIILG